MHSDTEITGYDMDANMLAIAEKKAQRENVSVVFEQGSAIMRNFEHTEERIQGKLPDMLREAKLSCSGPLKNITTIFGIISIFQAQEVDV